MDGKHPSSKMKIGPWTRLSSRDTYDNPWIQIREDQVLRPNGSLGIYGVVHYKNLAVGVVALHANGQVILVGQHRYPLNYYSWEIPEGGCLRDKETLEAAAARELREETGYTAKCWDYLGEFILSNSTSDEVGHLFLARELTPGPSQPDSTEEIHVKTMEFEEAWRQAMSGELTESMTIVGLARAKYFLAMENSAE